MSDERTVKNCTILEPSGLPVHHFSQGPDDSLPWRCQCGEMTAGYGGSYFTVWRTDGKDRIADALASASCTLKPR